MNRSELSSTTYKSPCNIPDAVAHVFDDAVL